MPKVIQACLCIFQYRTKHIFRSKVYTAQVQPTCKQHTTLAFHVQPMPRKGVQNVGQGTGDGGKRQRFGKGKRSRGGGPSLLVQLVLAHRQHAKDEHEVDQTQPHGFNQATHFRDQRSNKQAGQQRGQRETEFVIVKDTLHGFAEHQEVARIAQQCKPVDRDVHHSLPLFSTQRLQRRFPHCADVNAPIGQLPLLTKKKRKTKRTSEWVNQ